MKRVEIEWVDANILHGWQSGIEDCGVAESTEIGYVMAEDEDKIILARGFSNYDMYNSPMAIPKGCIKSIKAVRLE